MSCLYTSLRGGVVCLPMLSVAKHRLENRPEDDAVAHPSAPAPASWTTTCLNCGSPLSGPFCSKCGQRASPPHPALHDLLHDALHELVHWDGKIVETVRCLVTRPGALTCHVLEGRRARYISPVRLYLTCSLIYFLLAAAAPGQGASFGLSVKRPGVNASVKTRAATGQTEEDRRQILAAIPAAPRLLQPLMRRSVEDPQGLQRDAFGAWPKALFVLLPVFAGLVAVFYHKRHFPEHLYFALHLHAFAFLAMTVSTLAKFAHSTPVAIAAGLAVAIWIPVYAHLAFRRVYGNTHIKTLFKDAGVGVLYFIATIPAMFVVALWVASHPH